MIPRPRDLPNFNEPPLNEVVIGIQFSPIGTFSSIHAKDVWALYEKEFPIVQEQPALAPQFETFGGTNPIQGISLNSGSSAAAQRFWFISSDQSHLIQFQRDRFMLNWRKGSGSDVYPRFEKIYAIYLANLQKLEKFIVDSFKLNLEVTQVELSYINIIPVSNFSEIGRWFKLWSENTLDTEGVSVNFTEVIVDNKNIAFARLHHELQSVYSTDGKQRAIRLSLTFRGMQNSLLDGLDKLEIINVGHVNIVKRFVELTTDYAHKVWKRA